jgi:hypothetical protein
LKINAGLRLQVPHTTIIWLGVEAPGPREIENLAGLRLQVHCTTIIWIGVEAPGPRVIENFGPAAAPGPLYNNNLAWGCGSRSQGD